ncbi:carbohydrate kinase [bacterium]|nr:carbohydrate kinase [bacterium]
MACDVLCVGEVLWDALPEGLFLGGAPLNVAIHLRQLGVESSMVTAVGNDELGREVLRRLERVGFPCGLVQISSEHETGFVVVAVGKGGEPTYEILWPSAWDMIEATERLLEETRSARALVFGTLGQREEISRATIQQAVRAARYRIFDVNLRPPFTDREVVEFGLQHSHFVKMNVAELNELAAWFEIAGAPRLVAERLAEMWKIETLVVTRGGDGAFMVHAGEYFEADGIEVTVADAVGAGDSFLASMIHSLLSEGGMADPKEALRLANRTGAFVASQRGATPKLSAELLEQSKGDCRV